MTYKFLRRLRYLITKRGGKQRAFNSLLLAQYSLKPNLKILSRSNRIAPRLRDPFFSALKKLRVYFFIRKFTKNRKTLLLPGILRKRKRIRVIARWFFNALRKRGEPRLLDRLAATAYETMHGVSEANRLREIFNETVRSSKINIVPRGKKRRFQKAPITRINKDRDKKKKASVKAVKLIAP